MMNTPPCWHLFTHLSIPHRGRDDCVGDLGGVLHGCDTKAREHTKEWRPGVWLNTRGSGTGDLEERSGSRGTQQGWVALRWKVVDPVPPGPGTPTWDQCVYLGPVHLPGIWHTHLGRCTHLGPGRHKPLQLLVLVAAPEQTGLVSPGLGLRGADGVRQQLRPGRGVGALTGHGPLPPALPAGS